MAVHDATLSRTWEQIQFVRDRQGRTRGVFLPLVAWNTILTVLEDAEDLVTAREYLAQRATARTPAEMGFLRWEDVASEWGDETASET